ncbi:F-box protein At5g07610-like [Quercus robur]|uniref:F-box protein At5g07610-like n=1 Tax=Quercus robur TaxID=38942 RepID=UPI0021622358|nr:F-box protein At5g07610-like [Quercus robur]
MDILLESLKVEILYRLPLQSLALCKCISKHWFTLITFTLRVFAARHHNELPVTLLFQYPDKQLSKKIYIIKEKFKYGEFNTSTIGESVDVVASCKDILLCLGRVSSNNYYIVNCITMQWLKLPPVREVPGRLHVGLVCDSGYNNHDRMESWYRVVRLILDLHNNIIVEIFSSDTGEW